MAPFVGATGNPTTLAETVFSTIPGSPVYASKASQYTRMAARTGSRASTSRATTPSRATSASRPDGSAGERDVHAGAPACPPSRPGDPRRHARRARAWPPGSRCGCGRGRRYGHYLHHAGTSAPLPLEATLFVARLGADDRGDDAALEHPAGARRSARSSGDASDPDSWSCCCWPATCSCGARSGSARGSRIAASTPPSTRCRGSPNIPR